MGLPSTWRSFLRVVLPPRSTLFGAQLLYGFISLRRVSTADGISSVSLNGFRSKRGAAPAAAREPAAPGNCPTDARGEPTSDRMSPGAKSAFSSLPPLAQAGNRFERYDKREVSRNATALSRGKPDDVNGFWTCP